MPQNSDEFNETETRAPWWVDVLCTLALLFVIGGSLYECSGALDPPPPKCDCPQ